MSLLYLYDCTRRIKSPFTRNPLLSHIHNLSFSKYCVKYIEGARRRGCKLQVNPSLTTLLLSFNTLFINTERQVEHKRRNTSTSSCAQLLVSIYKPRQTIFSLSRVQIIISVFFSPGNMQSFFDASELPHLPSFKKNHRYQGLQSNCTLSPCSDKSSPLACDQQSSLGDQNEPSPTVNEMIVAKTSLEIDLGSTSRESRVVLGATPQPVSVCSYRARGNVS
jgi:hypothetical protein